MHSTDHAHVSACRPAVERQLRGLAGHVPDERVDVDRGERDPEVEELRARGVRRVRREAGVRCPGGAGGQTRRSAGQRGLRPAAAHRDAGRALLRHLQRREDLRPHPEAEGVRRLAVRHDPGPDRLLQHRLGLLLLGVPCREQRRVVRRNPGQEDDPSCGPIIDAVSIKTINTPQAAQSKRKLSVARSCYSTIEMVFFSDTYVSPN
jgi:hypothetical protein